MASIAVAGRALLPTLIGKTVVSTAKLIFQPLAILLAYLVAAWGGIEATLAYLCSLISVLVVWELVAPLNRELRPTWLHYLNYLAWTVLALEVFPYLQDPVQDVEARILSVLPAARHWPSDFSLPVRVIFGWFVLQFGTYCLHRLSHRFEIVWRFTGHGAHHASNRISVLNNMVAHPVENILQAAIQFFVLSALLDVDASICVVSMFMAQTFIVHSNVELRESIVNYILTSPAHHLRHHSIPFEHSDTNYAGTMILIDRLLGTFGPSVRIEKIGIEDGKRVPLVQQLLIAFRKSYDGRPTARRDDGAEMHGA